MSRRTICTICIAGVGLFVSVVFAVFAIKQIGKTPKPAEEELGDYEIDLDFLTKDIPTRFYFYGDEVVLSDDRPGLEKRIKALRYERIDALSESELMPDGSAEHYVLVVNDYSKNAALTEEDIQLINHLIKTTKYTFIYIGNRYAKDFIRLGLWNSDVGGTEFGGGVSIGFYERTLVYTPNAISEYLLESEGGVSQYPVKLGEMVVSEVANLVRSCK